MELKDFFKEHKKVAIALSGGIDSAYLLYAAKKYGAEASAYFVKSEFVPRFELEDAQRFSVDMGVSLKIINVSALSSPEIKRNGDDRCYFCKKLMFESLCKAAKRDGFEVILEGTNITDDVSERPGFRAIGELSVLSPLRLCGISKEEVRQRAREAGIFLWDKPSYSCLATRIEKNWEITAEKLLKTEEAEMFLFSLGFSDFRVRLCNDASARLELNIKDTELFSKEKDRISEKLGQMFSSVTFDLGARK